MTVRGASAWIAGWGVGVVMTGGGVRIVGASKPRSVCSVSKVSSGSISSG